jgi:hypothetical protein
LAAADVKKYSTVSSSDFAQGMLAQHGREVDGAMLPVCNSCHTPTCWSEHYPHLLCSLRADENNNIAEVQAFAVLVRQRR